MSYHTSQEISQAVAKEYGINVKDINSYCRRRDVADARFMVAYLLRRNGMSYLRIGGLIGRHHTTIIHDCNEMEYLLQYDKTTIKHFNNIMKELWNQS